MLTSHILRIGEARIARVYDSSLIGETAQTHFPDSPGAWSGILRCGRRFADASIFRGTALCANRTERQLLPAQIRVKLMSRDVGLCIFIKLLRRSSLLANALETDVRSAQFIPKSVNEIALYLSSN